MEARAVREVTVEVMLVRVAAGPVTVEEQLVRGHRELD
jgi:hypothetical protein